MDIKSGSAGGGSRHWFTDPETIRERLRYIAGCFEEWGAAGPDRDVETAVCEGMVMEQPWDSGKYHDPGAANLALADAWSEVAEAMTKLANALQFSSITITIRKDDASNTPERSGMGD